jgi:hypothetical protein
VTLQPSLGGGREDVSEDLRDLPSRSELSGEVRTLADRPKGVWPAGGDSHLLACTNDSGSADAFANTDCAFMHEESLLLSKMTVQRPAVAARSHVNVSAEEITVRVQDRGAQVVVGAAEDLARGDWLRRVRILSAHALPHTIRVCLSVSPARAPILAPQGSFRNTGLVEWLDA